MTCLTSFFTIDMLPSCEKIRLRGYNTFFMLNSTGMKLQLLIKTKIPTNEEVSCFKSLSSVFIILINVKCQQLLAF